jgi:hypothetical protein
MLFILAKITIYHLAENEMVTRNKKKKDMSYNAYITVCLCTYSWGHIL